MQEAKLLQKFAIKREHFRTRGRPFLIIALPKNFNSKTAIISPQRSCTFSHGSLGPKYWPVSPWKRHVKHRLGTLVNPHSIGLLSSQHIFQYCTHHQHCLPHFHKSVVCHHSGPQLTAWRPILFSQWLANLVKLVSLAKVKPACVHYVV